MAGRVITAEVTCGERCYGRVGALVGRLPALVDELAGCGLPDTVVHGDHPGNGRSTPGGPVVVLDFADSFVGSPAFDGLRLRPFLPDALWSVAAAAWVDAWAAPGVDPARALAVAGPLARLADAVRYQEFLDAIEPSERPYHEGDPAATIRVALALAGYR